MFRWPLGEASVATTLEKAPLSAHDRLGPTGPRPFVRVGANLPDVTDTRHSDKQPRTCVVPGTAFLFLI
jgi:hypothetical protein